MNRLRDKLVYLASPYSKYSGGTQKAFEDVCELAGALISEGLHIYCPIAHSHPIAVFGCLDPMDHNLWLALDDVLIARCDVLLIAEMPGWAESFGVLYERDAFERADKPVYYINPETLEIRE